MRYLFPLAAPLALAAFLSACASPRPEPGPPPPSPYPLSGPAHAETPAIASLMDSARADTTGGRLANPAAPLQRALRIEPRNPRLWQEPSRGRPPQPDHLHAGSCA